jgi:hypothetical protein
VRSFSRILFTTLRVSCQAVRPPSFQMESSRCPDRNEEGDMAEGGISYPAKC